MTKRKEVNEASNNSIELQSASSNALAKLNQPTNKNLAKTARADEIL